LNALPRRLPLLLVLLAVAACSGSQGPPPPVATPTPSRVADDGLQPMSSRDATPRTSAAARPVAPGSQPTLPPGHPPIGGATDPRGNAGGPDARGNAGALDPHGNPAASGPTRSAGSIAGTIALSPKLSVGAKDVLYVIAKKGASTLAVRRIESPRFPLAFEISGADAMTPGVDFEGPLDLVARVSRSGDAIPAHGDLEGQAKAVKVPATAVRLTIDTVRP